MEQPPSTPPVNPTSPVETSSTLSGLAVKATQIRAWFSTQTPVVQLAIAGAVLVVALLLCVLPPLQVPARISWAGCSQLTAKSPSFDGPGGFNISLVDAGGAGLRVKIKSTEANKLPAAAQKALPARWSAAGPLFETTACGSNKARVVLSVPTSADPADADALDLVSWNGKSWQWVGGTADIANGVMVAEVQALPPNVMAVQSASSAPVIAAELEAGTPITDRALSMVNEFAVPEYLIANDGSVQDDAIDLPDFGGANPSLFATSRNWSPDGAINPGMVEDVLADAKLRSAHVKTLADAMSKSKRTGLLVDYRGLSTDSRSAYTKFVVDLAAALHKNKKQLAVVLPAPRESPDGWDSAGYDYHAIGEAADIVQLDAPNDPTAYTSRRVERMLRWVTGEVDRSKLQVAFPAGSIKQTGNTLQLISYDEAIKPFESITLPTGLDNVAPGTQVPLALGQAPTAQYDPTARAYIYTLGTTEGTTSTVWLNTAASFASKLDLALRFNVRGITPKGLLKMANDPAVWAALEQYQAQAKAAAPTQLEVVWTIRGADGAQLPGGSSALTETTFVWTAPTNPGQYTIAAALPGSATRGQVSINVVQPTATPVPQPTNTPAPGTTDKCPAAEFVADVTIPDNTQMDKSKDFVKTWKVRNVGSCDWPAGTTAAYASGDKMGSPDSVKIGQVKSGDSVDVSVNMKSPDKDGNFQATWRLMNDKGELFGPSMTVVIAAGQPQAAPAASAGSAAAPPPVPAGTSGSFELGGQVDSFAFPDKMHYAGMNWVKHQVRWGPDDSPGPIAGVINDAHAKGFKVLLSVLGSPDLSRPTYFPKYAAFVGGLAKLGPEAIEIWNEENIDREWQNGNISPATYTELLKQSYVAIKNSNPGVMVVSGAPAPTGFFGGCGAGGCDDAPFVAGMAAAGAASYMDCIGVHYNEGIVSPAQTSGDPRSEHYTRYFWGMVNAYYGAMGGARKLCFTEMGYLTPQGYGGLPSWFAWAQRTTVDQQAQWLAQAASLSASSGKVRLIIIFNVDFTYYGDDPQAGYAIIRPGNSCPACEALHQVLGTRSR